MWYYYKMGIPLSDRSTERRTKYGKAYKRNKPVNELQEGVRSYGASRTRARCGSTPEQDETRREVMIEQKVGLVSPFAVATEVLGNVLKALALRRASVQELQPGAAMGILSSG